MEPDFEQVYEDYRKGVRFKEQLGLYETVENNENFFIGKQWEGVDARGNPTPTFNFLKRVTLFQVATVSSDDLAVQVRGENETAEVLNGELKALFAQNKIVSLSRMFLRNAAVDGDGCLYSFLDTRQKTVKTELVENTRVFFGNPFDREVQTQPWIIISLRKPLEEVQRMAVENGFDGTVIEADRELGRMHSDLADRQVTVLVCFRRDPETGRIWSGTYTRRGQVQGFRDTGLGRYPIVWMNWDFVQDCYHGHGLIAQLIPNQVFVNQLFAMVMRSLQTTAFPKVLYDKTRIPRWDGGVGRAIGVRGGDMNSIARILDPAAISPQVSQFIDAAINYTQRFMGAADVSLGDVRPDNTSAIIALQRSSNAPLELVKRNLHQALEDLGYVYVDIMAAYYGKRLVEKKPEALPLGLELETVWQEFDFGKLDAEGLRLQLDVGASSYWSEITAVQTLDNLLMQKQITLEDYLERIPDGYVSKKQELIEKVRQ